MARHRFVSFVNHHYRYLPSLPHVPGRWGELHDQLKALAPQETVDSLIFADQPRLPPQRFFSPTANNLRKCLGKPPSIFYFQGYGWQEGGQNYLLPVDGNLNGLTATAVNLQEVVAAFRPWATPAAVLLLDLAAIAGDGGSLGSPVSSEGLWQAKERGITVVARFSAGPLGILGSGLLAALGYYGQALTVDLLELFLRSQGDGKEDNGDRLVVLTGHPDHRYQPLLTPATMGYWPGKEWLETRRQQVQQTLEHWQTAGEFGPALSWTLLGGMAFGLLAAGTGWSLWSQRTSIPDPPQTSLSLPPSAIEQAYLVQIQAAKTHLRWQQASVFVRAIAELRQIPPDSPHYAEAQTQITQWSRIILDIAKGRAEVENWKDALAAAALVPPDQPALYQEAQGAMAQWQVQGAP